MSFALLLSGNDMQDCQRFRLFGRNRQQVSFFLCQFKNSHAHTRLHDRRKRKPEDSPTFHAKY